MEEQKNITNEQSSNKSWSEMIQEDKAYCYSVLDSDETLVEKIKLFACNPGSSDNIVADLIKYGQNLENRLYEKKIFPNGDDLRVFIARNRVRFDAINICFQELKEDSELCKANRRFVREVETALAIRTIYDSDNMVRSISHDCKDVERIENFVSDALSIVEIIADYRNKAYPLDILENKAYVVLQQAYIRKYFDILQDPCDEEDEEYEEEYEEVEEDEETEGYEEAEAVDVNPEENKTEEINPGIGFGTLKTEEVKTEQTKTQEPIFENEKTDGVGDKPKKKKKLLIFIVDIICLAICLILTIIALITKNSVVNIILLVTGVLEVGAAALLFYIARQRERFTCPECGTKRVHHRMLYQTTNRVSTTNGNRKTTYQHQYIDTYTCPECGRESEERVNKSGGYYMQFADGTVGDHRIAPNEF